MGAGVIDRSRTILAPPLHAPRHSQASIRSDAITGSTGSVEGYRVVCGAVGGGRVTGCSYKSAAFSRWSRFDEEVTPLFSTFLLNRRVGVNQNRFAVRNWASVHAFRQCPTFLWTRVTVSIRRRVISMD